ncbi:MAG: hypothetical protein ABH871_02940 [Pseudomonadota bacterium]
MGKIRPFFTRDVQGGSKSPLPIESYSSKPYPFTSASTYIPPEANEIKSNQEFSAHRSGIWNSILLRFGGFHANLKALAEPLNSIQNPELIRRYFHNRLKEIAGVASKNPSSAHQVIASKLKNTAPIWKHLVLIACGDGNSLAPAMTAIEEGSFTNDLALADCITCVAKLKPQEGRLLACHAVSRIDTKAQIHMLGSLVEGGSAGSTRLVGDLFVKIMEGSTATEREKIIYPAIRKIVTADPANKSSRRGFLAAVFRGWLSECPQEEVAKSYLKLT